MHDTHQGPVAGIAVLVRHSDSLLLCRKHDRQTWELPAGKINWDEDYLGAAAREVKEETGVDVRPISIINVVSNMYNGWSSLVVVVQAAVDVMQEPVGADDVEEAKWFGLQEVPKMTGEADQHLLDYLATGRPGGISLVD